jgi:hypothetical protein
MLQISICIRESRQLIKAGKIWMPRSVVVEEVIQLDERRRA